ncbi:hypothetical protein EXN66_Car011770 [Channa argus]|uniref:Uncharacterized protein n=1 Tax=Channa argus TaxID=215402 RepID=A0A6G1Q122_CHAAH|nr:hypothetical protein EXN66_Car011770 [Channa argus]
MSWNNQLALFTFVIHQRASFYCGKEFVCLNAPFMQQTGTCSVVYRGVCVLCVHSVLGFKFLISTKASFS